MVCFIVFNQIIGFWVYKSFKSDAEGSGFKSQFEFPLSNISVRSEMLPLATRDNVSLLSSECLHRSEWKWMNEPARWGWFCHHGIGMYLECVCHVLSLESRFTLFWHVPERLLHQQTLNIYMLGRTNCLQGFLLGSYVAVIWSWSISDALLSRLWSSV